ncbi:tautomerase family protein [Streptomyces sp. A1-5]|uniref:tautomerase family protein n=1 Tax=Streptomyces sp. A1-5 TaxID=2738410 RepID=UPI001F2B2266|nr:tautomerase family protein [Streptomyces sp. A1-5]
MPFNEVKIYEKRLNPETERQLIERLTEATVDVFGEGCVSTPGSCCSPYRPSGGG